MRVRLRIHNGKMNPFVIVFIVTHSSAFYSSKFLNHAHAITKWMSTCVHAYVNTFVRQERCIGIHCMTSIHSVKHSTVNMHVENCSGMDHPLFVNNWTWRTTAKFLKNCIVRCPIQTQRLFSYNCGAHSNLHNLQTGWHMSTQF